MKINNKNNIIVLETYKKKKNEINLDISNSIEYLAMKIIEEQESNIENLVKDILSKNKISKRGD